MKSNLTNNWIVCRICLKQPKEKMRTIFNSNDTKDMTMMILECGGVPIKKFDHYPDKICSQCFSQLTVAHKFRTTCQRSHKHLSKFIAPVVVEKNEHQLFDYTETEDRTDSTVVEGQEACEQDYAGEDLDFKLEGAIDDELIKKELLDDEGEEEQEEQDGEEDDIDCEDVDIDDVDVVDVFMPLEDEIQERLDEELHDELETVDENDDEIEYLDELMEDLHSSDEEFLLSIPEGDQKKATIKRRGRPPGQRATTSRGGGAAKRGRRPMGSNASMTKPKKGKIASFICDICGNKYISQSRLTEHIKLHRGIKPHQCEICGHSFAQTQQLTRHMNTHTGNRPYKCNYCPAAFADLSTRNKHHRIHTNERPYVCDVCGKSFTYTNTLKFHKMIHTGEKPHVCEICGKGFQQMYKLRNHRLTHERKSKSEKLEVDSLISYQEVNVATAQILEM